MILATAADPVTFASAAVDLVPVVVGAILALAGGVVAGVFQGRRDHERWLRERRYEAFVSAHAITAELRDYWSDIKRHLDDLTRLVESGKKDREELIELQEESDEMYRAVDAAQKRFYAVTATFSILGPKSMTAALNELSRVTTSADDEVFARAEEAFFKEAQKVLKVPTSSRPVGSSKEG
jgi:hypothetical protein